MREGGGAKKFSTQHISQNLTNYQMRTFQHHLVVFNYLINKQESIFVLSISRL